jgi:hypothetical protein
MGQEEVTDNVNNRLREFVQYFVKVFEAKFYFYNLILEGEVKKAGKLFDAISKIGDGSVGMLISVLGAISTEASIGVQAVKVLNDTIGGELGSKRYKKDVIKLSNLIIQSRYHEAGFRKELVEAGVDIFQSFEMQFMRVTCENGTFRGAMQLLAIDATNRAIDYMKGRKYAEHDSLSSLLTEGVLQGHSKIESITIDYKYNEYNKHWKTADLFKKAGLVIEGKTASVVTRYYKKKDAKKETVEYGYRRPFSTEKWDGLEEQYQIEDNIINCAQFTDYPYKLAVTSENLEQQSKGLLENINQNDEKLGEERIKEMIKETKEDLLEEIKDLKEKFMEHLETLEKIEEQLNGMQIETYLKQYERHFNEIKGGVSKILADVKELKEQNENNSNEIKEGVNKILESTQRTEQKVDSIGKQNEEVSFKDLNVQKIFDGGIKIGPEADINFELEKIEREFKDFITIDPNRILYIATEVGETKFIKSKFREIIKDMMKDENTREMLTNNLDTLFLFELCSYDDTDKKNFDNVKDEFWKLSNNSSKKLKLIVAFQRIDLEDIDFEKDSTQAEQKMVELGSVKDESFDWILKRKQVEFQGVKVEASKVIDISMKSLIPGYSLRKLLDSPQIGQSICDPNENLYIARVLVHGYQLDPKILEDPELKEKLIFDDEEFNEAENGELHLLFKKLDKDENVEKFLWKKSRGIIEELRKYLASNQIPEHLKSVDEYKDHITLIVDEAGSGKTTYFNHMAKKLKEVSKDHFVIKVCLNEHTDYFHLKKSKFKKIDCAVDFFAEVLCKNMVNDESEIQLQKTLLRHSIKNSKKCIVLLDGADEIAPNYEGKFLKIVDLITKDVKISKIFISTRPELKLKLEKCTKQFHQILLPFTEQDQIDCMIKYWKEEFQKRNVESPSFATHQILDEEGMKDFAREIISHVKKSINDVEIIEITGVPLITRMLAEIHEDQVLETCDSPDETTTDCSILEDTRIKNILTFCIML